MSRSVRSPGRGPVAGGRGRGVGRAVGRASDRGSARASDPGRAVAEWGAGLEAARFPYESRSRSSATGNRRRMRDNPPVAEVKMVFLGFGKWARADKIYALQ